ncbi:MAG: TauD/TfdA dioxygenase family protein [Roseobacter sp.]
MSLDMTPLTPRFGVEIKGIDLAQVDDALYREIRAAFEEHSALLFRGQNVSDAAHLALARRFGPIENREAGDLKESPDYKVPEVSNILEDGSVSGEMDLHTLNLKANMLWHADSTFLPIPALANILIGRVVTQTGGATELASTRAGWADMPEDMRAQIRGRTVRHHLSHSRYRISPELAQLPMFHKWPEQTWKAVWRNPVNGHEALYIASHARAIDGMDAGPAATLLDQLMTFVTQQAYTYRHQWQVGDVLIWDQRAVLHRATEWDYTEPRKLTSLCVSATSQDGVDDMAVSV